jgi:hypothetical protein
MTLVHGESREPYTLLKAFCLAVPPPYGIFVIGCNAKMKVDSLFLTEAVVTKIPALAPLSEAGYLRALRESWGTDVDVDMRTPLYHWAGGVPRLLRCAHEKLSSEISLASGGLGALQKCFEAYVSNARSGYPQQADWFPHAYTCLLASSTKAKAKGVICVDPKWCEHEPIARTYDDAAMQSIGAYDERTCRFMLPPITFCDDDVKDNVTGCPILPSQLHPFLTTDVIKHFGKESDVDRGRMFEKPFMYAVYARYLLVHLEDRTQQWVPLVRVFEGALAEEQNAAMATYEINLSGGVVTDTRRRVYDDAVANAVTYIGGTAHHDAYIWCRVKGQVSEFAVPLQLRHGNPKALSALLRQLTKTRSSKDEVPLLLSVNQAACPTFPKHGNIVMVNADAMSSISWLWLISPKDTKS